MPPVSEITSWANKKGIDPWALAKSISQKGKIISEETRKRISIGMKGKQNSLGIHHDTSIQTKEKIKRTLLGHVVLEKTRKKISEKNKGYKHTVLFMPY
jgi:hypothetical protein